jgi:hypothetical protein
MKINSIGTAWYGRHVVVITCNPMNNSILHVNHSVGAPVEPQQKNCTDTLGMFFSIGYSLVGVSAITPTIIQYVFVK